LASIAATRAQLHKTRDSGLQEQLALELRFLEWELQLTQTEQQDLRRLTLETLIELGKSQYTARGISTQAWLCLKLCLVAHQRRLRHLSPHELCLLLAAIPYTELNREMMQWLEQWARTCEDSNLTCLIKESLAKGVSPGQSG
jgi:hypothetical protein